MQTKYLILILGLLIVILAHGDRGRKAGGSGRYIKSILGIENGSGRRIKGYDYIRVLAVIAVIGTHVVQSDTQLSAGSPGWIGLRIAETAFLTCNVLFAMLSGALLLNRGEEPVASFYRKRVFRVVIPMAVYYMFYLYRGLLHSGRCIPANWLDAGRRFLSGPSDWNPHFWLMYVSISFYLTAPFFRVMVQNMSDRLLTSFVFLTFVMNSILVIGFAMVSQVILCSVSAFVISRMLSRKAGNLVLLFFMGGMMIPFASIMLPQLIMYQKMGAYNNYAALLLPFLYPFGFYVYLYKGFFDQIPGSYFEAASLDGASPFYLYKAICMPLSKPIISLIALQTFIGNWNDFFWAWLVTEDQKLWTLNVALYNISNNSGTKQNALMGLAVVTITPVILLSILFSKQLKQSIMASGVKG